MNNIFLEGPIQTGKSTLIRRILKYIFGPDLPGVAGFTSQRITDGCGQLLGFRLASAGEPISLTVTSDILSEMDNVFKAFKPDGTLVDMSVFENAGTAFLDEAFSEAKSGKARIILLDEIGGHELKNDTFRCRLYEILDSDIPCVGVIKSPDNTRHMDSSLLSLNAELHEHVALVDRDSLEDELRNLLTL